MRKIFADEAWADYIWWQENDRKALKRINKLLKSIERDGALNGIGKPEALKFGRQGWCSRRIDQENRLVYQVRDDRIEIVSCKGHYE